MGEAGKGAGVDRKQTQPKHHNLLMKGILSNYMFRISVFLLLIALIYISSSLKHTHNIIVFLQFSIISVQKWPS